MSSAAPEAAGCCAGRVSCCVPELTAEQRYAELSLMIEKRHPLLGHRRSADTLALRFGVAAQAELATWAARESQVCGFVKADLRPGPQDVELTLHAASTSLRRAASLFDQLPVPGPDSASSKRLEAAADVRARSLWNRP
jgi:hypothetical protein